MWFRKTVSRTKVAQGNGQPDFEVRPGDNQSFSYQRIVPNFPDSEVRRGAVMEEPQQTSPDLLDTGTWVGRQQAFALIANKCSAAQALSLKQMKDTRCHEHLGITWDDFCDRYVGLCRRQADRIISQYKEFGETYFKLSNLTRISAEDYRELAPSVTGACIEIDGDQVPIVPENAARIRAFVRAQKRAAQPGAPTVALVGFRLQHVILAARHCIEGRLSAADREILQRHVCYAVQEWLEIGHRLDKQG